MEPIAAVRAALPRDIPVVGNGDVKDVAAYLRMTRETGCDAVMIGRGAMGNPWLFRTLAALERGEPDPGPPSLAERHAVWRRHAALVVEHSPEKMRMHELRKTLAWYSRGLLRRARRCASARRTVGDPAALLDDGRGVLRRAGVGRARRRGRRRARDDAGRPDRQVGRPQQPPRRPPRRGRGTRRVATPSAVSVSSRWRSLLAAAGCEEVSHRDIGDEINILVRRNDALVGPATDRLASYRRSAIPQIETAMHTAAPAGPPSSDRGAGARSATARRSRSCGTSPCSTSPPRCATPPRICCRAGPAETDGKARARARPGRAGRDRAQARRRDRAADVRRERDPRRAVDHRRARAARRRHEVGRRRGTACRSPDRGAPLTTKAGLAGPGFGVIPSCCLEVEPPACARHSIGVA